MHFADDVHAVDDERCAFGHPERDVQGRPVFGDVDVLAPEHRLDAGPDGAGFRQVHQQPQRLVGDPVLGEIEVPARRVAVQAVTPRRITIEQLAECEIAH